MEPNIKIYCVLFDTMPLSNSLIKIAAKNDMQMLSQVGGCFTAVSLMEMFTGQMLSDLTPGGLGYYSLEEFRNPKTLKIRVPWNSKFITSKLSKAGWKIHLHNFIPNGWLEADVCTDSYEGGYKNRYRLIKQNENSTYNRDMLTKIFLKNNLEWQKRDQDFIASFVNQTATKNTFYFMEYLHFHSFDAYVRQYGYNSKLKHQLEKNIFDIINTWNFNEPNAIFWFFGDHGPQRVYNKIPKVDTYISWAMIKDNTKTPIHSKLKLVSIRDFYPVILSKAGLSDSFIKKDKNRIFFVEDGRKKFDEFNSTTALACKVVKWKDTIPLEILQVCYFSINNKFFYHLNILDKKGFCKNFVELNKNNPLYETELAVLKKTLQRRFDWIKMEGQEL